MRFVQFAGREGGIVGDDLLLVRRKDVFLAVEKLPDRKVELGIVRMFGKEGIHPRLAHGKNLGIEERRLAVEVPEKIHQFVFLADVFHDATIEVRLGRGIGIEPVDEKFQLHLKIKVGLQALVVGKPALVGAKFRNHLLERLDILPVAFLVGIEPGEIPVVIHIVSSSFKTKKYRKRLQII